MNNIRNRLRNSLFACSLAGAAGLASAQLLGVGVNVGAGLGVGLGGAGTAAASTDATVGGAVRATVAPVQAGVEALLDGGARTAPASAHAAERAQGTVTLPAAAAAANARADAAAGGRAAVRILRPATSISGNAAVGGSAGASVGGTEAGAAIDGRLGAGVAVPAGR